MTVKLIVKYCDYNNLNRLNRSLKIMLDTLNYSIGSDYTRELYVSAFDTGFNVLHYNLHGDCLHSFWYEYK